MTDEQMRIKIAEACGWKALEYEDFSKYGVPCFMLMGSNNTGTRLAPPDYLNDLNACAEFEAMLTSAERFTYLVELNKLCGDEPSAVWATARQRAEAFLKTKGILP